MSSRPSNKTAAASSSSAMPLVYAVPMTSAPFAMRTSAFGQPYYLGQHTSGYVQPNYPGQHTSGYGQPYYPGHTSVDATGLSYLGPVPTSLAWNRAIPLYNAYSHENGTTETEKGYPWMTAAGDVVYPAAATALLAGAGVAARMAYNATNAP